MRTIVLLRFLSEPELRESIQSMTNKVEAFHKFSNRLRFAGEETRDNDPDDQEKLIKFNGLLVNCLIFHTAADITKVVNDLTDEGRDVDPADLATITPYITSKIRRFGVWHLDTEPPDGQATGRLRMAAAAARSARATAERAPSPKADSRPSGVHVNNAPKSSA
jgi:hypothetical protein